jgi:sigma-B regulation protein RsbU (phosphoserine phosphatase)
MSATRGPCAARDVLVADDSAPMRLLLARTLAGAGHAVRIASDGHQLEDELSAPGAPRLVVTDWNMPGATGVEVIRRVRARPDGGRFHFIVVTSDFEPARILEALEAGADDFVAKPFRGAELVARVRAGSRVIGLQETLEQRIVELGAALAEVRTLRGLIPICMHCHRIRVGEDHWQRLEAYLEEHSDAELSHGLCEECLAKHYPEPPLSEVA